MHIDFIIDIFANILSILMTMTYRDSINACNGLYQYSDESVYDEETGELIDGPCCHKRLCFGVSKEILKFIIFESFNMDTKTRLCQDDMTL